MNLKKKLIKYIYFTFCLLLIGFSIKDFGNPKSSRPIVYPTSLDAQQCCHKDIVAWLNLKTHVLHLANDRWYGNTLKGAYVCEKQALSLHNRLSMFSKLNLTDENLNA